MIRMVQWSMLMVFAADRIATPQACLGAAFQQRWHPAAFKALLDAQSWLRRHIPQLYIYNSRNIWLLSDDHLAPGLVQSISGS